MVKKNPSLISFKILSIFAPDKRECEFSASQHLANVRFNINVLQVLVCFAVVQPQSTVQSDGHPNTIAYDQHLANLRFSAWVCFERVLFNKVYLNYVFRLIQIIQKIFKLKILQTNYDNNL